MTDADACAQRRDDAAADRIRAVERWVADVAHDIRTPLQALLMNIEVVRSATSRKIPAAGPLQVLEEETRKLAGLVDALTAVLHAPGATFLTFDVDGLIDRLTPLLQAGTRTRFVMQPYGRAGDGVLAWTRTDLFAYAVARAALGVREAMPAGGTLRVDALANPRDIAIRITGTPAPDADVDPAPVQALRAALRSVAEESDGTIFLPPGSTAGREVEVHLVVRRAGIA